MTTKGIEINFGAIMQGLILSSVLGVFYVSQQLQIGLAEVRKELAIVAELRQEIREQRAEIARASVERAQMKQQISSLERNR